MKVGILNSSEISRSNRFDSTYHLSESVIYEKLIKSKTYVPLSELVSEIFTAGRSKRVYVTNADFGYPYLSNSDIISQNPFSNCNYVSKKYSYDYKSFLKEGMIVTGRVGAIGQTAYISKGYEDNFAMGSDNIIRIVPKESTLHGYLYTYLVSKYGNTFFWKIASGGVQPYISEPALYNLPVPVLEKEHQKNIHNLIIQASTLRCKSNKLLNESIEFFDEIFNENLMFPKKENITSKEISNYQNRIDASYNIQHNYLRKCLKSSGYPLTKLSCYEKRIFIPNRGKRNYVAKGLQYLSTSEISTFNPLKVGKFLPNNFKGIESLKVKENWILIARSGQEILGSVFYVGRSLNNLGVNEHAIRLVVDEMDSYYIYAFLSSKFGRKYLRSGIFGSAVLTINDDFIRELLIPEFESKIKHEIIDLIKESVLLFDKAVEIENEAITLIENEIDSWQN